MRLKLVAGMAAATLLLAACSESDSSSSDDGTEGSGEPVGQVEFTGFIGGPGILTQTEDAVGVFNAENPEYAMTFIQGQLDQAPFQQLTTMYASGNVPTLFVIDAGDVAKVSDKVVDLSDLDIVDQAYPWAVEQGTVDGKVIAVPAGAAAVGLLYNSALIEQATGEPFDPATIRTRSDLEALFTSIEDAGTAPIVVSPLNWSLGAHFLTKMYDAQGDAAAREAFIADLKAGDANLESNQVFNDLMDTLDLMLAHNLNASAPIAGTIETDSQAFAEGKAAFWFMGDFQWPSLAALGVSPDSDDYGIMPVPLSDDADDPYNTALQVTSSFMIAIDATVNTPEQQEAAKAYLDWYVNSNSGQDYMVNQASMLPAYTDVTLTPTNPLSRSALGALTLGDTYTPGGGLPADHWNALGDAMVKYMAGELDRAGLASTITEYWAGQA
jgi:raffinose/stachyose/melibiose transport system substrate-binding protein